MEIRTPDMPPEQPPKTAPRTASKTAKPRAQAEPNAGAPFTPDEKKLAASISMGYQTMGMGMVALSFQLNDRGINGVGDRMVTMADSTAAAWVELGRKNPTVKAYLKKITEVSAAGTVIGIHLTMFIPLLVNRGVLPANLAPDAVEPEPEQNPDYAMNGVAGVA